MHRPRHRPSTRPSSRTATSASSKRPSRAARRRRPTSTPITPSTSCRPAFAQDNSALVESLFEEGKKLAAAGNYTDACPKFLASYNLEHRTGTALNLADCYEKSGQLASAWARFVEVATVAERAGQIE